MPFLAAEFQKTDWGKVKALFACLGAGVLTTACAGNELGEQNLALLSSDAKPEAAQAQQSGPEALMKATEYWRKEYQKNPRKKGNALNYARNLKAMGQKKQALSVLQHAANFESGNKEIAGEYGRLALDLEQVSVAERLLQVADDPAKPDWRVISARGTVFAKKGQYSAAIPFYKRALDISPDEPSVMNNLALAHMMNGDAKHAESLLRKVTAKNGPHARKARQNLALALGIQGRYKESASIGSSVLPSSHASANADYLKKIVRLDPVEVPAPVPAYQTAPSRNGAPLTPEQIIAQATAATSKSHVAATASKKKIKKVAAKTAKKPAGLVRTVATAGEVERSNLPFKPASY